MKRTAALALAVLAALPSGLAAQTRQEPNLIITVGGGVLAGTDLWSLPRQLAPVVGGTVDTLSLGRRISPTISVVVSGTYFSSPRLGYTVEMGYFGLSSEGHCAAVGGFQNDSADDKKACEATQGGHFPTSMAGFQAGVTYRIPFSVVTPYVSALAGLGALSNSFIETAPDIYSPTTCSATGSPACPYVLLLESHHTSVTWLTTLAFGNTFHLSPAYNARLEVRDMITSLPVATDSGMVNGTPTAKVGNRIRHLIGLTAGFDVILERSHRRRY